MGIWRVNQPGSTIIFLGLHACLICLLNKQASCNKPSEQLSFLLGLVFHRLYSFVNIIGLGEEVGVM